MRGPPSKRVAAAPLLHPIDIRKVGDDPPFSPIVSSQKPAKSRPRCKSIISQHSYMPHGWFSFWFSFTARQRGAMCDKRQNPILIALRLRQARFSRFPAIFRLHLFRHLSEGQLSHCTGELSLVKYNPLILYGSQSNSYPGELIPTSWDPTPCGNCPPLLVDSEDLRHGDQRLATVMT